MARVEVDQRRLVHRMPAHAFEEIQRIADRFDDALIGVLERRLVHETEVPVLRVVQVGEAALHQRAHEIQGKRRALVAAQ